MGTFSEEPQKTPLGKFIHLVEKLAACTPAQGRENMKPERWPHSSYEKLELEERETASLTVDTIIRVPPNCVEGNVRFGAAGMTDFRGKQIRHKNC